MGNLGMLPKGGIRMLPPVVSHMLEPPGVHVLSSLPNIAHILPPTQVADQGIPHIVPSAFSSFPPAMFAGQAVFTGAPFCPTRVGFLESCLDLYSPLFLNFDFYRPRVVLYHAL